MAKSYYDTLGVPRDASEKDVRSAYRRLARQFHPDVNRGDKGAESRFKEINEHSTADSSPAPGCIGGRSKRRWDRDR